MTNSTSPTFTCSPSIGTCFSSTPDTQIPVHRFSPRSSLRGRNAPLDALTWSSMVLTVLLAVVTRTLSQGLQTGKKASRIAFENGALSQMIQLGALRNPVFRVYSQVSTQVREIRTKQNLINPRYIAQHAKDGVGCRESRIPIGATEHVSRGTALLRTFDESHLIDDRKARCKVRDRPSGVRDDVLHTWCAREPVRVMQLSDCTVGIRREIKQIVG